MLKPYYARSGVTLYHGDLRDVVPLLQEPGIIIMDPPYSEYTHSKSRAGARKIPLRSGNGKLSRAAISRAASFGFPSLGGDLRRFIAKQCARLASRAVLQFSDTESDWLWRMSLVAAGLEYVRTGFWRKVGGSPQFTGDRPAVAVEAITICHRPGKKRWNGGGKHGWWETAPEDEADDLDAFARYGGDLVYEAQIVLNRPGGHEPRVHTTQKPRKLIQELVEDFSDPGELIYDWTAGFGTLAIAALRAAGGPRRVVLVELDERWCEAAAKRIDAEIAGTGYTPEMARGQQGLFA